MSLERGFHDFLVHEICTASTVGEAKALYEQFEFFLPPCRFIFSADAGVQPGLSVNREFSAGAVVRSLFSSERVLVLDRDTLREMSCGSATFPIDYSISLDSQALSYLEPFMAGRVSRVPSDFGEVFSFIAQDNVFVDPLPYCYENLRNINDDYSAGRVFEKLKAYEVLRTLDVEYFERNGLVHSMASDGELVKMAQEHMARMYMERGNHEFMRVLGFRQQFMYCLLLKMVSICFGSSGKSRNAKVIDFVEFCDERLATLGGREIALASAYFERGQRLEFFGKVQKNKPDLFEILDGMAWDLFHLRQLEEMATTCPDSNARYFFPSFLTFDKRLVEVIDMYPLKSLAYVEGEGKPMPFYIGDWFELVFPDAQDGSVAADRFYSEEAKLDRESRRDECCSNLSDLMIELEEEILSISPKTRPLKR